jgi:hypothetical protein
MGFLLILNVCMLFIFLTAVLCWAALYDLRTEEDLNKVSADSISYVTHSEVMAQKHKHTENYVLDITNFLHSQYKAILGMYKLKVKGTSSDQYIDLVGSGTRNSITHQNLSSFKIEQLIEVSEETPVIVTLEGPNNIDENWTCGSWGKSNMCVLTNYILTSEKPFSVAVVEPRIPYGN